MRRLSMSPCVYEHGHMHVHVYVYVYVRVSVHVHFDEGQMNISPFPNISPFFFADEYLAIFFCR